ncbi:DALR anticodon-binding domain-containing protein 3 [Tachysurus vachellii]|uniref:DALR anticodon-binding domain-containing protein 3 n=1 Tax=Tachysurus vachellii TaxID=175792 RepID=UPI00296A973F|nr:DALR anticodon-binding domain-containing protein 3 [Tachysurus vachellii]
MMETAESAPFRIGSTVRALRCVLRRETGHEAESERTDSGERSTSEPVKLWFKESSAKNLRNRDFLAPNTVLATLYSDGQVPPAIMRRVLSLRGGGVLPLAGCDITTEGLRVTVDRCTAFRGVLCGINTYLRPASQRQGCVLINCPALHAKKDPPTPDTLTLGQLRTVLIADHLRAVLLRQGYSVSLCPALPEESDIISFLRILGIDWLAASVGWTSDEREEKMRNTLENCSYRETDGERGKRTSKGDDAGMTEEVRINLKRVMENVELQGYDPTLGTCTVQREALCHLAQLDRAMEDFPASTATVLHVTSCQDEFRQQQTAMLWRATSATATQRLVVCGPVKTPGTQMSAAQYLQLRRAQMKEASEVKYGEQVEGQTWEDIIRVMTCATVRFELLSTAHTSPVTLDVQREVGVSTKGPRGGVFVMYNCARLHTLFSSYEKGVQQGIYPEIPAGTELDFSSLKEEGEWLLLFNYLIPFSELLDQSGQTLELEGAGARVNLRTEQVCRFLVSLSKDFSSYYNRVHVLGEPLPHLFNQMFCRLLLLKALRELYHSALDSLNLPPIPQL